MKLIRVAACALLATPLVLLADQPGNRSSQRNGGGNGGGMRSTTGRSDGDRGRGERNREDLEQFREKMEEFCKEHAPRRWAAMQEDKNAMRFSGMYFRFRGLLMLKNQDRELYMIKVRQIEIDDEEYGLMKEMREARKSSNDAEIKRITGRLNELSTEYISSRINERTHRIAGLERALATEKSQLASDQQNKDVLIKERLDGILSDTPSRSRSHEGEGAAPPAGAAPVVGDP